MAQCVILCKRGSHSGAESNKPFYTKEKAASGVILSDCIMNILICRNRRTVFGSYLRVKSSDHHVQRISAGGETKGERIINKMREKKYYIAYGSNLSVEQMAFRCPDAKAVGSGFLHGWRLLFKGCATIEPDPERDVPVLIWEISEQDEENLDWYEGFPDFYYKKNLEVESFPLEGGEPVRLTAMVYIMTGKRSLCAPSTNYYQVIEDGYKAFHFPMQVLTQALEDSF